MTVCVHTGDCRAIMRTMDADSVDCIVTSPPYWGLRDYGIAGQLGMETSLGEHLAVMVDVFNEARRVLKPTGTLWLNYGDCYATSVNGRSAAVTKATGNDDRTFRDKPFSTVGPIYDPNRSQVPQTKSHKGSGEIKGRIVAGGTLKAKDLCMVPNRLAIALQEAGWWVRSEIVWAKPNPMPESIRDRPTSSHEKLWLLAKSERYFYDAEAIAEPMKNVSLQRLSQPNVFDQPGGPKDSQTGNRSHRKAINNQAERLVKHEKWKTRFEGWDEYDKSLGRNKRNVWTVPALPFPDAHFATFPPALIEPCILAGCPEKVCAKCGKPWMRHVDIESRRNWQGGEGQKHDGTHYRPNIGGGVGNDRRDRTDYGFCPSCHCKDAGTVPGIVLDPFGGAGTTGLVADRLGRNAVLIEINPAYAAMAHDRIAGDAPLFADVQRKEAAE